jgi:hypothetical protein
MCGKTVRLGTEAFPDSPALNFVVDTILIYCCHPNYLKMVTFVNGSIGLLIEK